MVQVTVAKWGDSLAVRLPDEVVNAMHLYDGERVDVVAVDGAIRINPTEAVQTIEDWFKGKTDEEWWAEYRAVTIDWGPDVGREIITE